VVKASLRDTVVPRDFQRIAKFYHKHYPHIIESLFKENGYEVTLVNNNDGTAING